MFFSDMERKTLAITPPSSTFFQLRGRRGGGGGFGSSKKTFHCLLLLSCLLLSSVNPLHNLADFENTFGDSTDDGGFINGYYNTALAPKVIHQSFNGGNGNVCPIFSFLSDLGSENEFDDDYDDSMVPLMISNNLSGGGVLWLSLKPLHIIELQSFSGSFHIGEEEDTKQLFTNKKNREEFSVMEQNLYWDSLKFPFLHGTKVEKMNKEELTVVVSSGNGVVEQNQCWDSIKFLFFFKTELSNGVAVVFAVPMKATAPVLMLNLCKKPVFWVQRAKKLSMITVLVVAAVLLILIFCFNDHHHHDFVVEENSHIETPSITISPEMDSLLRSISKETLKGFDEVSVSEKSLNQIASSVEETSEEALNVKTATKEKKRRRNKKNKKKKGNNGLLLLTDVSSSHSGNSTPNSPMSPVMVSAPKPEPKTIQAIPKVPKPVLSHSATFPVSGVKSMMIERSLLALNVRAPGSKAKSRTEVKEQEETKKKTVKEYDIWGDHHLMGLNLMDRFKEVREGKSKSSSFGFGEEDDDGSESFFVKGPQNYLADSSVRFVSFCNQWG